MASTAVVVDRVEWGKDMEKQLENVQSWKEEMYLKEIPNEYSRFRELLEKYSKVPSDEVVSEIFKIVRNNKEGHPPSRNY